MDLVDLHRGQAPQHVSEIFLRIEAPSSTAVAECPALPGCVSQGKDDQKALANIKEAIAAWLWAEDQKAARAAKSGEPEILVTV